MQCALWFQEHFVHFYIGVLCKIQEKIQPHTDSVHKINNIFIVSWSTLLPVILVLFLNKPIHSFRISYFSICIFVFVVWIFAFRTVPLPKQTTHPMYWTILPDFVCVLQHTQNILYLTFSFIAQHKQKVAVSLLLFLFLFLLLFPISILQILNQKKKKQFFLHVFHSPLQFLVINQNLLILSCSSSKIIFSSFSVLLFSFSKSMIHISSLVFISSVVPKPRGAMPLWVENIVLTL